MDPLSIAASVAGLLTLSASIYSSLSLQLSKVTTAPKVAQDLLREVAEMRLAIESMSNLVDTFAKVPTSRRNMVPLEHVVMTLTHTILMFDDLKTFMDRSFDSLDALNSVWQRIRWARREDKVKELVDRLWRQKITISLILNILQCQSDFEAFESRATLIQDMDRLLTENPALWMKAQIKDLDRSVLVPARSIKFMDDKYSIANRQTFRGEADVTSGIALLSSNDDSVARPSFEYVLEDTWVYSRTRDNATDMSFSTRTPRSHAWSALSGLSLGDVSVISVMAFPISLKDLGTGGCYHQVEPLSMQKFRSFWGWGETHFPPPMRGPYRIVLLGDGAVGKSSIAKQYCHPGFVKLTKADYTIQDQYTSKISVDGWTCCIEITDTSGQDDYKVLVNDAIEDGEGFLVVYAIDRASSLRHAETMHNRIQDFNFKSIGKEYFAPIILVGNKSDRITDREVAFATGEQAAKDLGCAFMECSALEQKNITELFENIVRQIRQRRLSKEPHLI